MKTFCAAAFADIAERVERDAFAVAVRLGFIRMSARSRKLPLVSTATERCSGHPVPRLTHTSTPCFERVGAEIRAPFPDHDGNIHWDSEED